MKTALFLIVMTMVALVAFPVRSDTKTPITETSYSEFRSACYSSCVESGKAEERKKKVYCACACDEAVINCRGVVSKYNLKYEEQLSLYQSEIMPDHSKLQACMSKAGI